MDEPLAMYDEATRRRIDGASPAVPGGAAATARPPQARKRARFAGTAALMGAVAFGLQEVFDPPTDDGIVLEVDTSGPGRDDEPVTFVYDPTSVRRSRALVRPWLLGVP